MPDLTLGPFILDAPIGQGAMGEVWKAHHRDRGVTVAIKVLATQQAENPARRKAFFNEVRAVAQLNHPGIAWVLDYGTITAEASAATEGRLVADTPYLAMEYASRGTLAELTQLFNWSELRAVLLALLDALAHAHARGVIHRDLKPANVLLCSRRDARPGLKLCDFGIAFAMDEVKDDSTVAGTLHYMSPEQLEGRSREQGPWTDLYAFGCLAWRLTTGKPPFNGKRQTQLLFAQLNEPPPALITPTPIPDGFEDWLHTLLQKDPRDRFRCAADAVRALLDLGNPPRLMPEEDLRTGIVDPILMTMDTLDRHEGPESTVFPTDFEGLANEPMTLFMDGATIAWQKPGGTLSLADTRAGLPLDWRRPSPARPTLDLVGAGLKLFGLRPPTFVGRESERDMLWRLLAEVHRSERAHGVVIKGGPGIGKSRLATWIADRACEVGASNLLFARFSGTEDADGALRTMLLRRFQALRLEGEALTERLDQALDDIGVKSADLRRHTHGLLAEGTVRGASRYIVIRLLLEAISRERPVIMVLDDVHAGIDGIRFARHLQNAQAVRPFPLLMVLLAEPEQLAENNLEAELDALAADKRVETIQLGPLPREPFLELVSDLLGLEPELANQVVDRTAGNPLFAVQLIGDWVERDQLALGKQGFKLKKGVRTQLPPSLKYIWVKRLARVMEHLDETAEELLEMAAVLGMDVDEREWAGMADDPEGLMRVKGQVPVNPIHAKLRTSIVGLLLSFNLADETEQGFRFQHGQFREAILSSARSKKRLSKHHRIAACQLGTSPKDNELERYGKHLLAAGEREAAIDPLLRAVPAVQATVGRMTAWRLLDTVEHTLKKLQMPPSDIRWGRLYLERANLSELLGRSDRNIKWAAKAGSEASRHGWSIIAAGANYRLGQAAMRRGDFDMAQARFIRVTNQVDAKEHPFLVGQALFMLGLVGRRMGDGEEENERLLRAGRSWMMKDTDPRNRVQALLHLARASLEQGQPGTCAALTERARKVAIEIGDLPQQVHCLNYAAEVHRMSGELEAAAGKLRRAIEVFELIGDAQLAILRCNLALVLLDQGDVSEALRELDRALSNAIEVDRDRLRMAVQSVRMRALAMSGRYTDFDEAARRCREFSQHEQVGLEDSARSAEAAYDLLLAAGETRRAEVARAIAIDQYTKLKQTDALTRLEGSDG